MTRPSVANIETLLETRYDVSPLGTGKNWVTKTGGLPLMARAIAHALIRSGHTESEAISVAIGALKRWSAGGGHVHPSTRARAAAAVAHWEAMKAASHVDAKRAQALAILEHRFNPSQPRAPGGTSTGGQWAAQGGTAPSNSSTPQGRSWSKSQIGHYPPGMTKAADKKKWDNWFRFFAMTPEQQKTFLTATKGKKPVKPQGASSGPKGKKAKAPKPGPLPGSTAGWALMPGG